jgi:hypothetical protein
METAVEYLIRHSGELYTSKKWQEIFEKAKQMEKEQMKLSRIPIAYENKSWQRTMEKHFENWYNETFKSK